jgi:plasmid stabilization system protein ParE
MVKKIIWNKRGQNTFDDTINYLHDEVSQQSAETFFNIVYDKIDKLVKQPFIGRKVGFTKSVRVINLDKHRQMFYRIVGTTLYISYFFDTRQNPNKRPF